MDNWIALVVVLFIVFLFAMVSIPWVQGAQNLDCERVRFYRKSEYYSCVRARESVRIRELLEDY